MTRPPASRRPARAALALATLTAAAPALLLAHPAGAQQADPPPAAEETEDGWLPEIPGLDEMTGAAREAIERLREELAPALREMRDAIAMLDDYGPPEMLPNGDILIPRREDPSEAQPEDAPEAGEGGDGPPGSIDL